MGYPENEIDAAIGRLSTNLPIMGSVAVMNFDPVWAQHTHASRQIELLHVLRGTLVSHLGNCRCEVPAGTTMLTPSGVPHRDEFDLDEGLDVLFVTFTWAHEEDYLRVVSPEDLPRIARSRRSEVAQALEGLRMELAGGAPVDQLVANSRLLRVLLLLLRGVLDLSATAPTAGERDRGRTRRQELMLRAKQYMQENYSRVIGLDDVAAALNVSGYYLSHVFSAESNFSVFAYLTSLRLERARLLLRERDLNVAEVALEVGYQDANYFSKVFRKHVGCSPSEYAAPRRDSPDL